MERKTLIEALRRCVQLDMPCEECPVYSECIQNAIDAENGFCLETDAAQMLEDDAEQLQYADDTIQTLLHEQKETFLKLVPEKFPTDRVYYVPGALDYEEGFNAAIDQMIKNVNNWNFKRLDGRKETTDEAYLSGY